MTIKEDVDIEGDDIEDYGITRKVSTCSIAAVIGFNGTDCKPTIPICCFLLRLIAMNIDR